MGKTALSGPLYVGGVPFVGAQGLLSQGKAWFCKPSSGSDGNDGTTVDRAVKTLSKAHDLATANRNDTVYYFAESNTAASTTDYQSATLTWSKDLTHLVGVCAPSVVSQRARIAQLSTATGVSPLLDVTADGCVFSNISVFHGVADATSLIAVRVTGTRNYFHNVHFAGVGDATMSAAGACSLKIDGGAENVFDHCVIGVDTIARDADATELLLDGAATRNLFEDCHFSSYISAAGFASVTIADATGIDRWLRFKNCLFTTDSTNQATTQTAVFVIPAMVQGKVILQNSYYLTDGASGSGAWEANGRGLIWNNSVAAAASGAGGEMTKL